MSFHCVCYNKLFPSNHLEVEEGGDGIFLYHKMSLEYYKESLKITQKMHNKCYNNLVANVVSEVKATYCSASGRLLDSLFHDVFHMVTRTVFL